MKNFLLAVVLSITANNLFAQQTIPFSHNEYQKINSSLYDVNTRFHTSIKPFIGLNDMLKTKLDSVIDAGTEKPKRTWLGRKLFNEHLVDIKKEDYNFYFDLLGDFQIGRDIDHNITTYMNTRGFQLGGNIGKQFSFYTSGFENLKIHFHKFS